MSSLTSKIIAASHRPARWLRRGLRWLLVAVLGLWFVVLGLWLVLHWAILPKVDSWRPELEARATQWLGSSVRIGAIQVRTGGWIPALDLSEVRLLDAQGREALRLPRVTAALSARSLLTFSLRLEQLYVHQPELALRMDREGQLWIAGKKVSDQSGEDSPLLDWVLRQHEIAIQGGRLSWVDERTNTPPLTLQGVDLLLRNGLRRHELRLDANPPAGWGERFSLRARVSQPLLARPSQWQRWSGLLYAELPRARVAELRRHIQLPFDLSEGDGALRLWAGFAKGALTDLDLDLALRAVRMRLSPRVQPLQLEDLHGRLSWARQNSGSRWSAEGLRFTLLDEAGRARQWQPSRLTLSLDHPPQDAAWQSLRSRSLAGGRLQTTQLDLGLLAELVERLPLGAALHRELIERDPQGLVQQLDARWQGSLDAPQTWQVDASANDLAWAALAASETGSLGDPGLHGAALTVNANERGGQAKLQVRDGALAWPGLLADESLPLREAQAQLAWQRRPDQSWSLQMRQTRLRTPDGLVELDGQWRGPKPGEASPYGHLELTGRLGELQAAALKRYLPLPLDLGVRQYLADAIQGGQLRQVQLALKGPLNQFPFEKGGGQFKVSARAVGLRFAFVPSNAADETRAAYQSPWPALEDLNGELLFEGPGLKIRNARTRVGGLEAQGVQASIQHLNRDPLLRIEAGWRSPAQDALQFLRNTPIGGWTSHALDAAQASGTVSGRLSFQIPLQHADQTKVQGHVLLAGNELRLRPELPPFQNVRARADFTERSLSIPTAQARWLGGELKVDGGTQRDGSLRLTAQGQASAEGLRGATEWGALAQLAQQWRGSTSYQFSGQWFNERSELTLRSSLAGLGADLPEPFNKAPEASWPLHVSWLTDAQRTDHLTLQMGPLVQGRLQLSPGQRLRGGLRIGQAANGSAELSLPEQGFHVQLDLPRLDLDAWRASTRNMAGGSSALLPDRIALNTPQLIWAGRSVQGLSAGISLERGRAAPLWRATLQSTQASGYLEYQEPSSAQQPALLHARLARLALPKAEVERVDQALDRAIGALPGLDVLVDDFELRGMKLGRLELKAQGAAAGQAWALSRLALTHPDANFQAQGQWNPQTHRSEFDWQLALANSGNYLTALGLPDTVRGGKGEMKGQLGWRGSPLSPDIGGLDGAFSVQLGAGQFLKAQPGAARLLGVLSLQSLPRRLLFDWRDVFADGFAFDDFAGEVKIAKGVARSSNLRMRGPQASVLMDGSADLQRETADFKALVVPDVNAGGASLAYAAINPAIGLTTFLAQLLLRKPLAAANTQQFHIHGRWADPKVDKMEKPELPASAASN